MKSVKPVVIQGPKLRAAAKGQLPSRIELCHEGKWTTPWHGDFELNASDFYEAKGHFDSGHYRADNGEGSLPAGLDHFTGPAAYWIDDLDIAPSAKQPGVMALWGSITWTALGREKVERDEYRYTSMEYNHRGIPLENPESKGQYWVNVLTGSTLTNDPLFKKLSKVMASAKSGSDNNQGDDMDLETLRAKKPEELNDDERKFLVEHKADLTEDERKTFGLEEAPATPPATVETPPAPATAPSTPAEPNLQASANMANISKEELAQLQADAKAGREAQMALQRADIRRGIEAHAREGKVKTAEVDNVTDFLMELNPAQREKATAMFSAIPANPLLAKEAGSGANLEASASVTESERALGGAFGNSAEEIAAFKKAEAERSK